ncbi:MAG: hypothetical protein QXW70_02770 [Candidatus Anstonellales archaeon]
MKFSLTPALSYLIGLWKARRTAEGIGISGNREICEIFASQAIKLGIAQPNKIQVKGKKVFFYHSAYRAFFDSILEERLKRFMHKNEFSANYLAGLFDGCGGFKNSIAIFFSKADLEDEMILLRLGFKVKRTGKHLVVLDTKNFFEFVKGHLKFFGHPHSRPPT